MHFRVLTYCLEHQDLVLVKQFIILDHHLIILSLSIGKVESSQGNTEASLFESFLRQLLSRH